MNFELLLDKTAGDIQWLCIAHGEDSGIALRVRKLRSAAKILYKQTQHIALLHKENPLQPAKDSLGVVIEDAKHILEEVENISR